MFKCSEAGEFITSLYRFLIAAGLCFVNGAIVTDDPDGRIFKSLLHGSTASSGSCENVSKDRPLGTHMLFMNNNAHKKARGKTPGIDLEYKDQIQYQKILNPRLEYLCDPGSNDPTLSEAKGVILFYPFVVNKVDQYLYLKLEGYLASDPKHMFRAIKRYVLHIEKKSNHPFRREDDPITGIHQSDGYHIGRYLRMHGVADDVISTINAKITYYNANLRVGNELYLPVEIFGLILAPAAPVAPAAARVKHIFYQVGGYVLEHPEKGTVGWVYYTGINKCNTLNKEQLRWLAHGLGITVDNGISREKLCELIQSRSRTRDMRH